MKTIVNCETNDVLTRDLTDEEIEQQQIDENLALEQAAIEADKIAAKQSTIDKLIALGLTADEVSALIS